MSASSRQTTRHCGFQVQVPKFGPPHAIYSRGKPFLIHVGEEQPAYWPLFSLVTSTGLRALKKYMWAKRLDDETLAVHTKAGRGAGAELVKEALLDSIGVLFHRCIRARARFSVAHALGWQGRHLVVINAMPLATSGVIGCSIKHIYMRLTYIYIYAFKPALRKYRYITQLLLIHIDLFPAVGRSDRQMQMRNASMRHKRTDPVQLSTRCGMWKCN